MASPWIYSRGSLSWMGLQLKIAVLADKYQTRFNTPKISRHVIQRVKFLPANKISHHIEGLTLTLPCGEDLGHFHNRIPIANKAPFIMSFEHQLPRYFGGGNTGLFRFMRQKLAGDQCRRIVAMSHYAERSFLKQHVGTSEYNVLSNKLEVIYPNMVLPAFRVEPREYPLPLRIVFVGAHFGRKGGAVAARAAEIARFKKLPMHFRIISTLQAGHGVWSDPQQDNFFEPYFRLLDADNVTFDRGLPNARVLEILRDSDFSILTTFSDTFGFSAANRWRSERRSLQLRRAL